MGAGTVGNRPESLLPFPELQIGANLVPNSSSEFFWRTSCTAEDAVHFLQGRKEQLNGRLQGTPRTQKTVVYHRDSNPK